VQARVNPFAVLSRGCDATPGQDGRAHARGTRQDTARRRAAAHLWGLLKGLAAPPEVTAPADRRIRGVVTHRARGACAPAGTTWRGVPVTAVATTLIDVAASLKVGDLARVCHEAGVLYRRTTPADVEAALARRPNAAGTANLRRILRGDVRVTRRLARTLLTRGRRATSGQDGRPVRTRAPRPAPHDERGGPRRSARGRRR
jgi:hypothetical protein